ncbi:hypothetical protein CDAR_195961 [Caerostris darwini]|uniref:Uncharacterized protein n=1 Tax=Caerostris darwini TaxID=1538125 RepID=A0AAV4TED9_9ARAC|nr:hypothetical protein CDAR_195961 [Caerostris darwini]
MTKPFRVFDEMQQHHHCIIIESFEPMELHGSCDDFEKAYRAYRTRSCTPDEKVKVKLSDSKPRASPLKRTSLRVLWRSSFRRN